MPQQIHEADRDASVHVQDEVGLLGRRDLLHLEGVVKERSLGEVGLHELLDQGHPENNN